MTTDFFNQIAALGTPGNWKINIASADNINFVVSVHFTAPKGRDQSATLIPTMLFRNTSEKLGEVFFRDIAAPVQQTAEVYSNMEAYHQSLEQAKIKSKEEQDKKRAQTTTPKKEQTAETDEQKQAKEGMKRAYEEALKTVAAYIPQMKYAEALEILPLIADYPDKKVELEAKRQELEKFIKLKEKSLFAFNNG